MKDQLLQLQRRVGAVEKSVYVLGELLALLNNALPLKGLLDYTTKTVRARMNYPHCAIAIMDEQIKTMRRVVGFINCEAMCSPFSKGTTSSY